MEHRQASSWSWRRNFLAQRYNNPPAELREGLREGLRGKVGKWVLALVLACFSRSSRLSTMGRKRATSRIAIAASFVWVLARGELNTAPGSSPTSLILSDAIYERYLRSARISTPGLFPYATDATGSWSFLPTDSWTSGFYPGVLYLLRERQTLCPSASYAARNTDWLGLARRWR